ncbi:MAG: hypothetical protein AB1925_30030 [Actinomycetota bacterium]
MNERELDSVLETTRKTVGAEVRRMMQELYVADFTMPELMGLLALVKPAWERAQKPAPVYKLELVGKG